jgi:hypothetical protein
MKKIPQIGECFQHNDHFYRVTGWVRLVKHEPLPTNTPDTEVNLANETVNEFMEKSGAFGRLREQWCLPEEATHVTGSGIAGCIVRIELVHWEGKIVNWSPEQLEADTQRAKKMAGRWVY